MAPTSTHQNIEPFAFVVADDHPSVSLAVCQICEHLLSVPADLIATVSSSASLLELCEAPSALPRIIVLDLVMPGKLHRALLVHAVRKADPSARVVAYTSDESAFLAKAVMDAGALAYVCKSSPTSALADAIVWVSKGLVYTDPCIDFRAMRTHPWSNLTDSERVVLLSFCRGQSAADIVANTGRSYSTVTTHKYNGLHKLGLRDISQLIPYLYEHGLICELDEGGVPGTSSSDKKAVNEL
jgi:DNA-binding NarL/FixJ family response regulator